MEIESHACVRVGEKQRSPVMRHSANDGYLNPLKHAVLLRSTRCLSISR